MKLVKRGKVKEVYSLDEHLVFRFTNNLSVFDKIIPSQIPRKGEVLCKCAAYWFEKLNGIGVHNHFVRLRSPKEMEVRKVNVIKDYRKISKNTKNYLIPLEFVCRHYVGGSLWDRLSSRKIKPESLGLTHAEYGTRLPEPLFEVTTKLEKIDRKLSLEEALNISGLLKEEYDEIKEIILVIDEEIKREVGSRGLIHVDGKKEFAFDEERNLMVVDCFGTPDEDRFWDEKTSKQGEFLELSKEFVRQYYRKLEYHKELMEAREKSEKEPEIPPLPDEMITKVSMLYQDLYRRITGKEL